MKEVHLSDGAMAALREDIADGEVEDSAGYIAKALDEVEWLRRQWYTLGKERDAARARATELEKLCAEAERLMDDVVLPKSKAIEEERDASRAEAKHYKALYGAVEARASAVECRMAAIHDALGWPECNKLSLIDTVKECSAARAEVERALCAATVDIESIHENGENFLVWHDFQWKCASFVDEVGVWPGWYVTGGNGTRPMEPAPTRCKRLPPDDESKEDGA